MAYQLTCPSCPHRVSASFIRVGAVARCPSCAHVYRVQESHVMRSMPPEAKPEYVKAIHKEAEPGSEDDPTTLSGLSALMQREAVPKPAAAATPPLPEARASAATGPTAAGRPPTKAASKAPAKAASAPRAAPDAAELRVGGPASAAKVRRGLRRKRLIAIGTSAGIAVLAVAVVTALWKLPNAQDAAAGGSIAGTRAASAPEPEANEAVEAAPDLDASLEAEAAPARAFALRFVPMYEPRWTRFAEPEAVPTVAPSEVRVASVQQRFSPEAGVQVEVELANLSGELTPRVDVAVALLHPDRDEMLAVRRATLIAVEPGEPVRFAMPMPAASDLTAQRPREAAWVESASSGVASWASAPTSVEVDDADASAWRAAFVHDGWRASAAGIVVFERHDARGRLASGWWSAWHGAVEPGDAVTVEPAPPFELIGPLDRVRVRAVLLWDTIAAPPMPVGGSDGG